MKAVLIMYNAAIDAEVDEALKLLNVDCYSKFAGTLGRGRSSEPHFGSDVWPAVNNSIFIVADAQKAESVMGSVRQIREKLGTEGIKAFMWQIEDVT
ncbi:MAG TPA: hypothetical protein VMW23_00305 [Sedimentisphaerales bacterium]|nr:hypothetical protein [Sedimentisphaerales bacterium]